MLEALRGYAGNPALDAHQVVRWHQRASSSTNGPQTAWVRVDNILALHGAEHFNTSQGQFRQSRGTGH
jgi:hypothetical protein